MKWFTYQLRCMLGESYLMWALKMFPPDSEERQELVEFVAGFMRRRTELRPHLEQDRG